MEQGLTPGASMVLSYFGLALRMHTFGWHAAWTAVCWIWGVSVACTSWLLVHERAEWGGSGNDIERTNRTVSAALTARLTQNRENSKGEQSLPNVQDVAIVEDH
jgi:hypothetical protein